MPYPKARPIEASVRSQKILEQIVRRQSAAQWLVTRAKIILKALAGESNSQISRAVGLDRNGVRSWRQRWIEANERRRVLEAEHEQDDKELEAFLIESLSDQYRSGAPPTFSAEQVVQIIAIACEDPANSGYPISHWTPKEVAAEAIKRGVVTRISERQVGRFLKRGGLETASESLLVEHQGKRP
jgi:putative transposase